MTKPLCPECGSERLIEIYRYGPTGVVAPDGGRECREEYTLECLDCGAIEHDADPPPRSHR